MVRAPSVLDIDVTVKDTLEDFSIKPLSTRMIGSSSSTMEKLVSKLISVIKQNEDKSIRRLCIKILANIATQASQKIASTILKIDDTSQIIPLLFSEDLEIVQYTLELLSSISAKNQPPKYFYLLSGHPIDMVTRNNDLCGKICTKKIPGRLCEHT